MNISNHSTRSSDGNENKTDNLPDVNWTGIYTCWYCPGRGLSLFNVFLAVVAMYLLTVKWIYFYRNVRGHSDEESRKEKIETILLSVPLITTIANDVWEIYFFETWMFMANYQLHFYITYLLLFTLCVSWALTYGVLWLRQRTIYSTPSLLHLSNKATRFISKYFICYTIVVVVIAPTAFTIYNVFFYGSYDMVATCVIIIPFTIQIPLLALMMYPLYKHHKSRTMTNPKHVALTKRIIAVTIICGLSDVTSTVFGFFSYRRTFILTTCLLVNTVVNVLCVSVTPIKWKEKILPCVSFLARNHDVDDEVINLPQDSQENRPSETPPSNSNIFQEV